jgi:site-specific DNA-methyltransferase (adenine-specific)/modification methylase
VAQLPEEHFDLLAVDPPYNLGSEGAINIPGRSSIKRSFGEWDSFDDDAHFLASTHEWLNMLMPTLKPNASTFIFCAAEYAGDIKRVNEALGLKHKATITWHKTNPPPHFRKTNFISSCESIVFSVRDPDDFTFNWLGQANMHNFIEGPICMGDERLKRENEDGEMETLHPTQKPEWVIRHLLSISGVEGGWLLDPFMGTGTVPHVGREFGMNGVGIELDEEFYQAAVERIDVPSFDYSDEVVREVPEAWISMT